MFLEGCLVYPLVSNSRENHRHVRVRHVQVVDTMHVETSFVHEEGEVCRLMSFLHPHDAMPHQNQHTLETLGPRSPSILGRPNLGPSNRVLHNLSKGVEA